MVSFITGNARKAENLKLFLQPFNVDIVIENIEGLFEIQSDDVLEVAKQKGLSAYQVIHKALIVNDGGWSIPALNGFPGAYMKDVNRWLSATDMWNMMREKEDKRIFLQDTYACVDNKGNTEVFSAEVEGAFVEPNNEARTLDDIVVFKGSSTTISNITNEDRINMWKDKSIWREIGEWITTNI
jgi:non-canonical purine NTP pyrophosphatase (RdgB/HAM1 family)